MEGADEKLVEALRQQTLARLALQSEATVVQARAVHASFAPLFSDFRSGRGDRPVLFEPSQPAGCCFTRQCHGRLCNRECGAYCPHA